MMIHEEVRKCIIEAWKRGVSVNELVRAYGFSKTAIYDLVKLEKQTGSIEPRLNTRGRRPKISEDDLMRIDNILENKSHITLNELRRTLKIPLSEAQMSRIVRKKLGYVHKKRWYKPKNSNDQL